MPVTAVVQSAATPRGKSHWLVFVDALRVAVVIFVIVHHAAQAYGPTGGFWPLHDRAQNSWFVPLYTVNAALGMGLLFLLAGYFVPGSYERKGPLNFLRAVAAHRNTLGGCRSAGSPARGLSDRFSSSSR